MQQKTEIINKYNLLGVQVNLFTIPSLLEYIEASISKGAKTIITHHNLHSVYLQRKNAEMQALQKTTINHIDGMPLVVAGRLLGMPFHRPNRITLVDYVEPLMQLTAEKQWRVFYIGSDEKTASVAIDHFRKKYPQLNIKYRNGFFNAREKSLDNYRIIKKVAEIKPDLVIVGMGMPRQEKWLYENKDKLQAGVIITCGAAMEYFAGTVKTPPRWMGRSGMEWLFRFVENPKKFWFRYMIEPWFALWLLARDFRRRVL